MAYSVAASHDSVSPSAISDSRVQQRSPAVQYGGDLHIMPNSLRRIPTWYEPGNFQYNARLIVGVAPGLLLLLTVTGKPMLGAILAGGLFTLLVRYIKSSWASIALCVGHVVVLEMVNVYCMAPLIWRSMLNLPLYGIFHIFIGIVGVWWWLQDEEFRKQEPRFTILLEKVLFSLYPAISVTMVTWVSGILFGKSVLPFMILAAGFVAFSLYLVPLQSSFSKRNTSDDTALIQHQVIVWMYTFLLLTVPSVFFTALSYDPSVQFFLVMILLVCSPIYLLSLLEAQNLGQWFGQWPALIQYIRIVSGSVVTLLVSVCIFLTQPPSFIPIFLLPILIVTMTLATFAHSSPLDAITWIVGGVLALIYCAAFTQLPWSIRHTSSFLSLPLSLVQLLVWIVALVAAGLMTLWTKATPFILVIYNAVFILCEFILTWDDVYPNYLAMATAVSALYTFWRLHSIGRLELHFSLAIMCLHLTKLCLLYPCPHSPTPLTSSLLPLCSTFLTSFLLIRLFLFDHSPRLSGGRLLVYSAMLLVGLLLSVDTFVSPLWASLTHTLPSSASLVACVLGVISLYVNYGCSLLGPQDEPRVVLSVLPPAMAVIAAMLTVLQPEFNLLELKDSVLVTLTDRTRVPEQIYFAAWTNLLTWLILFSMVFALIQLAYPQWPELTTISLSFLGVLSGFNLALSLAHSSPGTPVSLLYAAIMGLGGALCGRAYSTHHKGHLTDYILFVCLYALAVITYSLEWFSRTHSYIPGRSLLDYCGLPSVVLTSSCSLCLVLAFRLHMYRSAKEEPYLPVLANFACLAFFITAPLHKFQHEPEISVLFSSLIFVLSQPDGCMRPQKSFVFLAPSLLTSCMVFYVISLARVFFLIHRVLHLAPMMYMAVRVGELICLFLSMPGQVLFLYSLWVGEFYALSSSSSFSANRIMLFLYLLPNGILPQISSNLSSIIIGNIGIFSFCLSLIGNSKLAGSGVKS